MCVCVLKSGSGLMVIVSLSLHPGEIIAAESGACSCSVWIKSCSDCVANEERAGIRYQIPCICKEEKRGKEG